MEKCKCGAFMTINKVIKDSVVIKTELPTGFVPEKTKYYVNYQKINVCPACGEHSITPRELPIDPYLIATIFDEKFEDRKEVWTYEDKRKRSFI